ncbi:MAG: hypothetical protein XU15_C0026G0024 [candidate division NC10 bacterium CSP1-5]|nr:MAG: hypothetical protein XU15_C0026G0024 [candidate division NC10 bacterium CSP1-5]
MAVTLDGTSEYYLRSDGLKSAADAKVGTFACWFRRAAIGSIQTLFSISQGASERFSVTLDAANLVQVAGSNSAGVSILAYPADVAITNLTNYHHLVTSWDLANAEFHLYLDRVEARGTVVTQTDANIDYTGTTAAAGARSHDAARLWNGDIAEVFFDPTTFVDLSDSDELGKFVSQDNSSNSQGEFLKSEPGVQYKPVGYGHDASFATGARPSVFLHGYGPAFGQNKGIGGSFNMVGTPANDSDLSPYRHHAKWPTPGLRWFMSERSGFLYPRGDTFVEKREGIPGYGQRMGQDELDDTTREEQPHTDFLSMIFQDREDDKEEKDR